MFGVRRWVITACAATFVSLLLSSGWTGGFPSVFGRALPVGLAAMIAFGVFERWPRRVPSWRWVVQVVAVAIAVPLANFGLYLATGPGQFWNDPERLQGFTYITALGVMIAPWIALGALVRQKDALARHQALAFELDRSELEREAQAARLHLLQAQVAPHFLFNALANVQALVDAGSPQASPVLRSLTAYLRASVSRLDEPHTTLGQELQLVEAYLELMHMRMPDRLAFALHVDDDLRPVHCPPITLLSLVENAVRHGIDPSEEGGRIDIDVVRADGRCRIRVRDTGVGLGSTVGGLGTGLRTLRERLRMTYGSDAELRVTAVEPHGVCAEIDLPAVQP